MLREVVFTDTEKKHMNSKGGRRGGMNWETGIDTYTLLCTKQRMNEDLLHSTGNSTRCSLVT